MSKESWIADRENELERVAGELIEKGMSEEEAEKKAEELVDNQ